MDEWIRLAKALSDENRVRALLALRSGELCACRIIELTGLAPATVSAHMAVLQRAGLVAVRRDGRWRHFRLAGRAASPLARKLVDLARRSLRGDAHVTKDERRVKAIRTADAACAT